MWRTNSREMWVQCSRSCRPHLELKPRGARHQALCGSFGRAYLLSRFWVDGIGDKPRPNFTRSIPDSSHTAHWLPLEEGTNHTVPANPPRSQDFC